MKRIFAILFVMLLLQGCVTAPDAPFVPSTGFIITGIKAPLTTEFDKQKIVRTYGEASTTHIAYYILNFGFGDASLKKAIKDGRLENASYADYEWASVLGLFGRLKVNVYGPEQPEEDDE